MSSFSTGLSDREKRTNWDYLKRIFTNYSSIPLKEDSIDKIINMAPNAAFDFLCVIYKFLTKKEPFILKKINENNNLRQYDPYISKYMRPTAIYVLRDNEIQRIKDDVIRNKEITESLRKHRDFLFAERQHFIKIKPLIAAEKKRYKARKAEMGRKESRLNPLQKINNETQENDTGEENAENASGKNDKKEEKLNMMNMLNDVGKTLNEYNIEMNLKI